jgi:hypothetical protein
MRSPLLPKRGKTIEGGTSSRYSSRGGSALGAKLELFSEDRNYLFGIVLPPLGSDLSLYIEVGVGISYLDTCFSSHLLITCTSSLLVPGCHP